MTGQDTTRRRPRKGPRPRKVPLRMCIACREHDAKRAYVRVVRTPEMSVEVDPTGKRNGRGAYVCRRRMCWQRAIDGSMIDHALRVEVDAETREALREYARSHFPPDEE
ncbi:MAG TPA: YlxR family protein [Thermomicrobiales bacterium]|nr:YlxR family protein [Thermomicrobiales bacterium]